MKNSFPRKIPGTIHPQNLTVRHGKMVIGRTSFSFWGQQPIFCRGGFFVQFPVPGIFFFSADVCWLGVKKTSRKLWCFFRSKSLDEVYNLGSPPPPWLGPCWAMLACWVVKLGSLHRSGPKKRWKFVQEFWEDKKKGALLRGIRWTQKDIAEG